METKVIGVERSCFRSRSGGEEVKGFNLSDAKASAWGLDARALLGHTVQALYNRWGKLAALSVTD